jgi:hypothetical protein
MKQDEQKVDYKDQWLIIIGVPIINLLNYYLTYPAFRFDTHFFITYTIDTVQGYLAWYCCRAVIIQLDKYLSWEKNIIKRMIIQVPLVCITLLGVIIGLTEILNYFATNKPVPAIFYTFDIYIFLIWGFFINVLYLSLYLYNKLNAPLEKAVDGNRIWIRIGKQQHPIDLDKARCFYVDNESVYALLPEGKRHIPGLTLDRIEKRSDPDRFFRANRQFLITRDLVKGIRREENGKLAILLSSYPDFPELIIVSRLRAPVLRQWIGTSPTPVS